MCVCVIKDGEGRGKCAIAAHVTYQLLIECFIRRGLVRLTQMFLGMFVER